MNDKLKQIRDLFNEVVSSSEDGEYDVGFWVPGPLEPDPYVVVMLGKYNENRSDVDVLAHLKYDDDTRRWNYFEGDVE